MFIEYVNESPGEIRYQHDTDLIMLFGDNLCCEWRGCDVGVRVSDDGNKIKLAFYGYKVVSMYQSFYIKPDYGESLTLFFRALGFKVPDMPDYSESLINEAGSMDYALHVKQDILEHQINHPDETPNTNTEPQDDEKPTAWAWKKGDRIHVTTDRRFKHYLFKCGYELIPLFPGKPFRKVPRNDKD